MLSHVSRCSAQWYPSRSFAATPLSPAPPALCVALAACPPVVNTRSRLLGTTLCFQVFLRSPDSGRDFHPSRHKQPRLQRVHLERRRLVVVLARRLVKRRRRLRPVRQQVIELRERHRVRPVLVLHLPLEQKRPRRPQEPPVSLVRVREKRRLEDVRLVLHASRTPSCPRLLSARAAS